MLIKREILPRIMSHLSAKEMTVITGARQVGKTTIMKEMQNILEKEGKNTLYFNLDYESDFEFHRSQEKLLQKIQLEVGAEKSYIFIDEIQRKENAGLFLKGLFDRNLPYKFIISGSGSMELKERIHESLTGRKRIFAVYPVNFREFINFRTDYKYEDRLSNFFSLEKAKTLALLNEYLVFGGYPRLVVEKKREEKLLLMNDIYDSYLVKDVAYLLNVNQPQMFTKLVQLLANSCGSLLNYSKLARDIGISFSTLKKYLWYAEKTFIVDLINPFFRNKRKEIRKSETVYFNDLGLRNYALNDFSKKVRGKKSGFHFQNFIYILLRSLLGQKNYKIHYWRTTDKAEVDFVINKGNTVIPVEVKFSKLKKSNISRSFRNFLDQYKPQKAFIVNLELMAEEKINSTQVKFLPFYKLYEQDI
ncbi:MAG: ATP-binding protein [Candidatus Cloacimonetes bacterium]|nr:ATP-binding protein [Candidatus Cloacimonadota bacterium]MBS3768027.1 ATP-binding protein [Candidatus Cloacimonadota bacterium]